LESARVLVEPAPGASREKIARALEQVFGVAWFSFGKIFSWTPEDPGWEGMKQAARELAAAAPAAKSFKVFARRSAKNHPAGSQEICRRLGGTVIEALGLRVDLDHHDLPLHVEVLPKEICVFAVRTPGLRGMPQGTSGGLLCLFSGGIDSPVAAWHMMRRGALVHYLHFHPYRSSGEVIGTKITGLLGALQAYHKGSRLFLAPHDRYQVAASLQVPTAYETVFFRRFMFRVGEVLARRLGMKGLITGDSLGQVASQTLENLNAVQTGLSVPVFQPLIAQDKDAIIRTAREIGCYEMSIQPYKDCCSLMAKKPKTKVAVPVVRRLEAQLGMDRMIEDSLAAASLWDGETLSPLPPKALRETIPI
jgi:thiamine biosynthesis protein ThiI